MDEAFIFLKSAEGEFCFVNIYQIVAASILGEEKIVIHTSDGRTITVEDAEVAANLFTRLAERAITVKGESLLDSLSKVDLGENKIRIIKHET